MSITHPNFRAPRSAMQTDQFRVPIRKIPHSGLAHDRPELAVNRHTGRCGLMKFRVFLSEFRISCGISIRSDGGSGRSDRAGMKIGNWLRAAEKMRR
ncbi:MAG: hypothetical protein ACT4N8_01165 [Sphingosinicella sp.]|uniref:hypothetical protein n=1 Tax=Sphingosinicella sp. TaxID=1917971 RepID=UPI00403842C0